jgi:predicted nuclease of predicted toxin-antitoxin system
VGPRQINGFTLVTLDSDFAEMATLLGAPPKVVWLRCGNQPTVAIEALIRSHAALIAGFENDEHAACVEIY